MPKIRTLSKKRFHLVSLLPAFIALFILTLFPILYTLYFGLNEWSVETGTPTFVGFKNYVKMVTEDKNFWHGLRLTLTYTVVAVSIELIIGFIIASLLNQKLKLVGLFRILLILPMVLTPVVIGLTWRILYSPTFGLINYLLSLFGIQGRAWVADAKTALWAIIFVDIWQWTPFMFLMIYAGLQSLPTEPFDAALVDGASPIQMLRKITLPLLKNIIVLAIIFRSIDAFFAFDIIFMLTKGGPGTATQTLNIYSFYTGFNWLHLGYVAAIATTMFVIIFVFVLMLVKLSRTPLAEID